MDLNKVILNVLNNQASKEEYEILESWKKESQENIEFLEMLRTNAAQGGLKYKDFDAEKAWVNMDRKPKTRVWLYAACLPLLCLVGYYFLNLQSTDGTKEYNTENQIINIALEDNSKIWLNENSTLAELTDFDQERKVSLRGEAFFDVAHLEGKPFTIDIGNENFVKVIGTSFNLLNEGDDFDLAVYSGLVELHVLDRVIEVGKGKRVKLLNGSYVKVRNSEKNLTSWKDKVLIFEDTPIRDVAKDIEKHYDVKFNFDQGLNYSECRLRSRYENQKLEDILSELEKVFSMQYDYSAENRIIDIRAIFCN